MEKLGRRPKQNKKEKRVGYPTTLYYYSDVHWVASLGIIAAWFEPPRDKENASAQSCTLMLVKLRTLRTRQSWNVSEEGFIKTPPHPHSLFVLDTDTTILISKSYFAFKKVQRLRGRGLSSRCLWNAFLESCHDLNIQAYPANALMSAQGADTNGKRKLPSPLTTL